MKALKAQEISDQRREYMPWKPKQPVTTVTNQETVEEFLLNGGKVTTCPELKIDPVAQSRKCCSGTFERVY
jgi:hypothetical protein